MTIILWEIMQFFSSSVVPNVFSKQTFAEEFSKIQELHFLHEDVRIMFMMFNEEAKTNETLKVIWKKKTIILRLFFVPDL